MATPVPPPSPRHLRLLRLLLSGLVLGAALRGAAAGRPGERARGAPAVGAPRAGDGRAGVRPRSAVVTLLLARARRPRLARPGPVNRPGGEGAAPEGSSGWGFSRVLGGELEVHWLLVFVWVREPAWVRVSGGRCAWARGLGPGLWASLRVYTPWAAPPVFVLESESRSAGLSLCLR